MKGQISITEAIISAIALFIAFNMIIPTGEYQTKWKESLNSLEGRDILISAERSGKLHDYPFSPAFRTDFLSKIDSIKDTIVKNETQGTVKNTIYVACDCTPEQRDYLQEILNDIKLNTRGINAKVCISTLPTIDTCGSSTKYPNAVVIWGNKNLGENEINALTDFAKDGNGIIEIADLDQPQANALAQQTIFGIKWTSQGDFVSNQIQILKPRNSSLATYQSYKWFYHLPYLLNAPTGLGSIPVDPPLTSSCATIKQGNFKFQGADHLFWICDGASVYFDTNGNNNADIGPITKGQSFSLGSSNFKLNYIESTDKIRVSFKSEYRFNDFLFVDNNHNKIFPFDDNKDKILLAMGFWNSQTPVSALVLNKFENGLTAWLANFGRSGLSSTGNDHKQLISSLIFSASNKNTKQTFQQVGQIISYINANNTDMLEIYKIDLSIGTPF